MNKFVIFLVVLLFSGLQGVYAQVSISGTVTDTDGDPVPGVTIASKGLSGVGTISKPDGTYSLEVPSEAEALVFSFVGMQTIEEQINGRSVINVVMERTDVGLDEVVVTALGISREKKALGYAVQEVSGDEVSEVKETNFISSLSGKTSGVQIKQPNTMGGSANIVIRGNSSILGNNQALFVVDGVIIDNNIPNVNEDGWGGYDYGNTAMDINPDNIESISVLKSAAATALYGSRASNGAIVITTKSGKKNKALGITVNSSYQVTEFDPATMPKWQDKYGQGYGNPYYLYDGDDPANGDQYDKYFLNYDIDGDGEIEKVSPTFDDASWGAPLDAGIEAVQWYSLHPLAENRFAETPYVSPGKNPYREFFQTGHNFTNSVAIDGGNREGSFRLNYTRMDQTGNLPNSEIKRNVVNLKGSYNLSEKWKADASINYVNDRTIGRYGTGYNGLNPMQSIGQWMSAHLDFTMFEDYKYADGSQRAWNWHHPINDLRPYYADNPYWVRYENYSNDGRDRVYGYAKLSYEAFDWLTLTANFTNDFYAQFQEERIAIGSAISGDLPDYTKRQRNFHEYYTKFHAIFNKDFGDVSLSGLLGASMERANILVTNVTTEGGLALANFYDIDNSVSAATVAEADIERGINSVYGQITLGYKGFLYLDVTARNDVSSTLPDDNNSYFYPSVSGSFILSELAPLKELSFLSFAKLSANYAQVGSAAPAYSVATNYNMLKPWSGFSRTSVPTTLNNANLKPENTKTWEIGFDARFLENRVGFTFAYYNASTFDQILPLSVSSASGFYSQYINAGEMSNKGFEFTLNATPVKMGDFSWRIDVNWFKNTNELVSLGDDIDNILLFSAWDVSVNATEGEPYGAIKGTDYVYNDNGEPMVGADGFPMISSKDTVIGNINPDWNAGISNTLTYKNFSLRFLVDMQIGGDIYSVSTKYGQATGLYEETAGTNPKGNPMRTPVADGGGYLFEGFVKEDGTENDIYVECQGFVGPFYYGWLPTVHQVYDASYVKLRELALTYRFPKKYFASVPIAGASVSLVGRNLWIIHKNTKHFDPEAALSAGNNQGIESGSYPSIRSYGVSVNIRF